MLGGVVGEFVRVRLFEPQAVEDRLSQRLARFNLKNMPSSARI